MASEIRVNQIQSRTGVSTISFTETGPIISGVTTITGDLDVTGLVSYDDVTNIDSVGVVTARSGVNVTGGSVAIGVNSPSDKLHVGGNNAFIRVDRPNGNPGISLIYNSTNSTRADIDVTTGGDLRFATNNSTERLRIDSSGNVGIGTDIIQANTNYNTLEITGDTNTTGGGIVRLKTGNLAAKTMLFCDTGGFEARVETSHPIVFSTDNTERFRIREAGGHRIQCNESWHAANLSECNTDRLALNINQTRQGQTKGIALGCIGGGSGSTGIQCYDTSNNSANTLELNPFGGKLLYGDTQSDLIGDHKTMFIGEKHAFQYDGNAGTYLSVILGSGGGTVDLEADARTGAYPAMRFITTNYERLRITNNGTLHHPTGGNVWHGASALDDFSNAGVTNYNRIGIRAGSPDAGTTPTANSTAIKIYPVGSRSTTTGNLTGGIAWQHLDPSNGSWDTNYGAGAQIWMGASLHDTPGQERDRFNLWMNSQTAGNSQPNQLAIEAYPNGMVRHPKVPAFMVRNSGNSGAFSGGAIATWNITILNNGSAFANGKFTAPIPGIYHFSCMMLSQAGTRLFHEFRVNGTRVDGTRSEGHAVSGSYQTNTITMTYSLSSSDYVEVYVGPNAGYGGTYTNFNGFLIG